MLGGYAEEAGARSSIRARGGGAVAVLRGRRLGALGASPSALPAREYRTTVDAPRGECGVTSCEAEARAKT